MMEVLNLLRTNASELEIIWSALALICFVSSCTGVWQAWGDYRIARDSGGRPRWPLRSIIARGHIRREIINTVMHVGFLSIGLWALITPPPVRPALQQFTLVVGLIGTVLQLLLAYNSVADRYDRLRLWRTVQINIKGPFNDRDKPAGHTGSA